jgi:hypothetical protein
MFRATTCPSSGENNYQCDTWYLSLWAGDRLVCRVEWNSFIPPCIPDGHPLRVTDTRCRIDTVVFSWRWAHSCPKYVANINKHTKKKLCTKLILFARLKPWNSSSPTCINMIYWHHRSSCIFARTIQKYTAPFACNVCINCNDFKQSTNKLSDDLVPIPSREFGLL